MGWVVNKTTFDYRQFVNTPDYSSADWLINPDMSVVEGYSTIFWIVTTDPVTGQEILGLLTPEQMDVHEPNVDINKNAKLLELEAAYTVAIDAGFISSALTGSPRQYSSSNEDQINLVGAVTMTTPFDPTAPELSIPYNSTDVLTGIASYQMHSYSVLRQVLADGATFKLTQLQKLSDLMTQVELCSKISDINNINW